MKLFIKTNQGELKNGKMNFFLSFAILIFLLIFTIIFNASASAEQETINNKKVFDPLKAILESQTAYNKINDYTAIFLKQEKHGKKMGELETIKFKFRKPNDIYMKWVEKPFKGQEVIYRKNYNKNKITAHKGGILGFISMDLAPESKLVMKGQHHKITDAGIGATANLVFRGLIKGLNRKEIQIVDHGIVKLNKRNLRKIEGIFPKKCEGMRYEVQKGENLWDISKKLNQDMNIIITVNKNIHSPKAIKAGQKIFIPHHYCHRSLTYIDVETKILTKIEIFDWNNELFEVYEFQNIEFNLGLNDKDFNKNNPEYKF